MEEGQKVLGDRLTKLEEGQEVLGDRLIKLEARLENEVIEKVRALFDARETQSSINDRIIAALERIEAKVDVLQMETAHLRRIK
ncbi:MAG: hypothetical protein HPY81_07970 [Firmicutes bacterium]|nr:hypothetical protein [Bacillota bacterium]